MNFEKKSLIGGKTWDKIETLKEKEVLKKLQALLLPILNFSA